MKPSYRVLTLLAATLATGAMAQATHHPASAGASTPAVSVPSAPTPAGAVKIAIIAFQPAVAQTNEGQRDFGEIQKKFAPQQADLKAKGDEIDSLKKQLQAAGSSLSQNDRATRLKVIDDKEKSLQRAAQDAQADFQQQMSEIYQKVAQKFYPVLQDYCVKNGYTLVLDISSQQSPVVYADRASDITPAVIQAYNIQSGVPAPVKSTTAPAGAPSAVPAAPAPSHNSLGGSN